MSKYYLSTDREKCTDLFGVPYALNDVLDKQRIYLIINISLPHGMPNHVFPNDFKRPTVLQWLHCTQFVGALALVAGHLHTAHVVE